MATSWNKREPSVPIPSNEELTKQIIEKIVTENLPKHSIVKWLMYDSGYNYSRRHCYDLINQAQDTLAEAYKETARTTLYDRLNELERAKKAALQRNEHRLAFDIDKEINKILGFYKERIDINANVNFRTSWSNMGNSTGATQSNTNDDLFNF